jgi:hypothetical protein
MTLLYGKDANGNQVPLLVSANGTVQTSGLWSGTSSQLTAGDGSAVTVGSGLTLSSGTLTSSGGSETVFDVNFAALSDSTQTLSNGNVVIGGVTYTIQNATNASSFQFVNGSGFVVTPQNVGGVSCQWNYSGSGVQRTAPAILLPFASILSATAKPVTISSRVRAFIYITGQSFRSSPEDSGAIVSIDNNGSAGSNMFNAMTIRGYIGGPGPSGTINVGLDYVQGIGSFTANTWATGLTLSNSNVIGVEGNSLLPYACTSYYGAWSSGWPSFSAINAKTFLASSSYTGTNFGNDFTPRTMKAIALAFPGGTGSNPVTIARLRVDVW